MNLSETLRDLGAAAIFGIAIVCLSGFWVLVKLFDKVLDALQPND